MTNGIRKHVAICPNCRKIVKALPLTYQQWEVAKRLIDGQDGKTIARELFIGRKTVESHRRAILDALGVQNVPHLIRWAHDKGLLDLMNWGKPEVE